MVADTACRLRRVAAASWCVGLVILAHLAVTLKNTIPILKCVARSCLLIRFMGCRYPGTSSPRREVVREAPETRR